MLDAHEKAMRLFVTDPDTCAEIVKLMGARNTSMAPKLKMGLTRKQRELLEFISDFAAANDGVMPSFDEMKDAVDLASKSGIYRLLTALEERGVITRLPNRARAISIVVRKELEAN